MTNTSDSERRDLAPLKGSTTGRTAAAIATVLWLLLTVMGISLIDGIRDQNGPGATDDGKLQLYVVIPLIGSAGSAAILGLWRNIPSWAKLVSVGVSYLAAWLVLGAFGGGV
jgi:hypothetical protein